MPRQVKDCGCGGGKNCITKRKAIESYKKSHPNTRLTGAILAATAQKWVKNEMERLDCGCGCKGLKGFSKKYLKGGKLNDCPNGFDTQPLTCLEKCGPDEFDDGLTCRKKCPPGQIDDGLTCRVPITSSMNGCPPGSRDIAGTCWGEVRRDCVDDCFKHPAPGCRTYQCGRLHWAGIDWGPRLCTDCNLRCGQTCWGVQGITKQLHERDLRVMGGEVYGQPIRGKRIIGRVNWEATLADLEAGLKDVFSDNGPLARAFDPAKNGVNAAFEKFGKDTEAAFKAIGEQIKRGFEEMGAAAKKAFEDFAAQAERDFKKLGDDILHKLKDPYFWADFVSYTVMAATMILTAAATVATGGLAAPAFPGLLAAAALIGPAIRMTADGINGKPIDALDIAEFGLSLGAALLPAAGPAMSAGLKTLVAAGKGAIIAGQIATGLCRLAQQGGYLDTCIANCPGQPPLPPPVVPPLPNNPPKPKKTDAEIEKLIDNCYLVRRMIRGPGGKPVVNPDNCGTTEEGIAKWRLENEGEAPPAETPEEKTIREAAEAAEAARNAAPPPQPPLNPPEVDDDDFPSDFPPLKPPQPPPPPITVDDDDDFPPGFKPPTRPAAPPPITADDDDDFPPGIKPPTRPVAPPPITADDDDDFPPGFKPPTKPVAPPPITTGSGLRKRRGGKVASEADAIVAEKIGDRTYQNPWSFDTANIGNPHVSPPGKDGKPFEVECYANNYPELAKQFNNDKEKLTAWWNDVGHKDGQDPSCGSFVTSAAAAAAKEKELLEIRKVACEAVDAFWTGTTCDYLRNADGTVNTAAEECRQSGSWWDGEAKPPFCNRYRNLDNNMKSEDETCRAFDNFWNGTACEQNKNVDGRPKTEGDFCTGLNNFWDGRKCIVDKDKNGVAKSNERMCHDLDGFYKNGNCNLAKNTKNQQKDRNHIRQALNYCNEPFTIGRLTQPERTEYYNKRLSEGATVNEALDDLAAFPVLRAMENASKKCSADYDLGTYPRNHKEMEEYLVSKKGKFKKQYEDLEKEAIKQAFENGSRVFKDKNNQYAIGELVSPTSYFWFGSPPEIFARHPGINMDLAPILDSSLMEQTIKPTGSGKRRKNIRRGI
jgi:hypothetical protein